MRDWNVVLTSSWRNERRLLQELKGLGEFKSSGFREVIIGKVPDVEEFLENVRTYWEERPFLHDLLCSVVPIRVVFPFTLESLEERLKEEALALVPEIGDASFYVRMKRRGHKGELSSKEVEQALGQFLLNELAARGQRCQVNFTAAELIVVVETIHNQCGLGLVTRGMKDRFPFVKVK